jgi:hypothetical protein
MRHRVEIELYKVKPLLSNFPAPSVIGSPIDLGKVSNVCFNRIDLNLKIT